MTFCFKILSARIHSRGSFLIVCLLFSFSTEIKKAKLFNIYVLRSGGECFPFPVATNVVINISTIVDSFHSILSVHPVFIVCYMNVSSLLLSFSSTKRINIMKCK